MNCRVTEVAADLYDDPDATPARDSGEEPASAEPAMQFSAGTSPDIVDPLKLGDERT